MEMSISGSGDIFALQAEFGSLSTSISGSGEVFYGGSPSVETSVSGSGSVKKIEAQ